MGPTSPTSHPLPPALPAYLYHHCRDGDSKVSAAMDQANVVVSIVVEDTFLVASAERKMGLVEAWERVIDNCRSPDGNVEAEGEVDLVTVLDNIDEDSIAEE